MCIRDRIIERTIYGLEKEGRSYKGVLYAGLMLTSSGPKVVEFNCRFGDPEAQAIIPLLKSDLAEIFSTITNNDLPKAGDLQWFPGAAACVVLASKGYPGKAETGKRIFGLRNYSDRNVHLFHSGTRKEGKNWISCGGRVVGVTAVDRDLNSALSKAYGIIEGIKFDGMVYRGDIGHRAGIMVNTSEI